MQDLLFLAHRIPYPPNKGDKIRSFNLLKHLAGRYRVHLGAFVDDPNDWRYARTLETLCKGGIKLQALHPRVAKLRSLRGLLSGDALTVPYYQSRKLGDWVNARLSDARISRIVVFSSAMAQYVMKHLHDGRRCVVDFVDVDSDKWRQYGASRPWPMSWLYRREGRLLLTYDRAVARCVDASVFVSTAEAALFARLAPESEARVAAVENGVDTEFFSPARTYTNPYLSGDRVLVFTGAMDYWANVDAVNWFAREVFPAIRERDSRCCFYIVGARPTDTVRRLADRPGVRVTGAVEDIRPYLHHATFAVAPLRLARGVQNKVLEAMAMGKVVLATRAAVDGLQPSTDSAPWVADTAPTLVDHAQRLLDQVDLETVGCALREYVLQHYNWSRNLQRFISLLEPASTAATQQAGGQT